MIWPSSSPHVFALPQLPNDDGAHLDPILDVCTGDRQAPYAVITSRSIYLVNCKTHTVVNAHVRSRESMKTYGANVKVKRAHNGCNFVVQSANNYLLVYSTVDVQRAGSSTMDEVLSIYDKQQASKLLQNGFPIAAQGKDQNIRGFFSNLFAKSEVEVPNHDLSLRFKLVLKIQSALVDFITLPENRLLLITRDPKALQLIHLGDSHNNSNIEVTLVDELDWYSQDKSDIVQIEYEPVSQTLYWLNEESRVWAVKVQSQVVTSFQGALVLRSDEPLERFAVDQSHNLLTTVTKAANLHIHKLRDQKPVQLVSINKKPSINKASQVRDLKVSPCGSCVLVLYDKGWSILSVFGNLNFSTFDFAEEQARLPAAKNWFTTVSNGGWSADRELVFVNAARVFVFKLIRTNATLHQNSLSLKRPVLYNDDYISVFKGFEKRLNDYSSESEVLNNKESELWYHVQLPTSFKLKNSRITALTASDDGQYVCCSGDSDLIIYHTVTKKWKFLINDYHSGIGGEFHRAASGNNILQSLWFENHLILAVKADEHSKFGDVGADDDARPTTEVLIFSNLIWNDDVEFNAELCIWNYTFSSADLVNKRGEALPRSKPKEDFLYFNLDDNKQLIVLTTELNCYFFDIAKVPRGPKAKKPTLQLKCNKVFSLKRFFQSSADKLRFDPRSIKSVNKINENDLLILVNGDVIYLRQSLVEEDIASSFTSSVTSLAKIKSTSSFQSLTRANSLQDMRTGSGATTPKTEQMPQFADDATVTEQTAAAGPSAAATAAAAATATATTPVSTPRRQSVPLHNGASAAGTQTPPHTPQAAHTPQMAHTPQTAHTPHAAAPQPPPAHAPPAHAPHKKRPSIRFEKIALASGVEYLYKLTPNIVSMFNGNDMIYFDLDVLANARLAKYNISKVEPLCVGIDDETVYLKDLTKTDAKLNRADEVNVVAKNHSNIYPFVTILDQNCIIGFEVDAKMLTKGQEWFSFNRRSVRKDFLNDLLDYYLRVGEIATFKSYSEEEIYERFSKFKNYQFCLELLVLNYLISENDDSKVFDKLIKLIRVSSTQTSSEYVIYLSLLKKIETKYWFKFFKELGETPRQILNDKIMPSQDYKLGCHYLILTLNYERQHSDGALINDDDKHLILEIMDKLVDHGEFQICFELVRYIKFMDQENKLGLIDDFLARQK